MLLAPQFECERLSRRDSQEGLTSICEPRADKNAGESDQTFGCDSILPREELYQSQPTECLRTQMPDMVGPLEVLAEDNSNKLSLRARFDGNRTAYLDTGGEDHEGRLLCTELETVLSHVCGAYLFLISL